MKKTLIIISLLVVLVGGLIPLVGCGGGTKLSESDLATIRGFSTRLDAHDSAIATIQATIANLDIATLDKLAALDTDALEALLNLDTDALQTRLTALETWKTAMEARVAELETGNGGGGGGSTPPSGEVTAVLDVNEVPFLFTSTTASQVLPVKITNGTGDYQQVKFNLTLQCVSVDGVASITGGPAVAVNTVPMLITYVPNTTACPSATCIDCQLIYATWADTNRILVAPGKETTVYVYLTAFTTLTSEVWQATLSGIVATKL
jgi:hypothetical protein